VGPVPGWLTIILQCYDTVGWVNLSYTYDSRPINDRLDLVGWLVNYGILRYTSTINSYCSVTYQKQLSAIVYDVIDVYWIWNLTAKWRPKLTCLMKWTVDNSTHWTVSKIWINVRYCCKHSKWLNILHWGYHYNYHYNNTFF